MTTQTHAQQLANRFAKLNYNDLTPESRHAVKRLLLDYLGVALAGSQSESGEIAREFARLHGAGKQSQLFGDKGRASMTAAAFANAISSHSIELDDIDVLALFHFSPPVYSSALAVADATKANGKQLVTALAAGQDHTCASADGTAYCWGNNWNRQLGYEARSNTSAWNSRERDTRYEEKALGASDADIRKLFFVEAGALGLLGGLCGVAFGWAMSFAMPDATRCISMTPRVMLRDMT